MIVQPPPRYASMEQAHQLYARGAYVEALGCCEELLAVSPQRLDVLLHVKWTVTEFDCPLTRDIVQLIDREADMLNRGRSEASLQGLRTRLANLFLQFIETPEFNPEAGRFQKVPHQELILRPNGRPIPTMASAR